MARRRRIYYGDARDRSRRRRRNLLFLTMIVILGGLTWRFVINKEDGAGGPPLYVGNQPISQPPTQLQASAPPSHQADIIQAVNSGTAPSISTDVDQLETQSPPHPVDDTMTSAGIVIQAGLPWYEKGKAAVSQDRVIEARGYLSQAVALGLDPIQDNQARLLLNQLSDKWLFSRRVYEGDPHAGRHVVQSGELLSRIAPKYKVPYQLLMRVNGIEDPRRLQKGQTLKVVKGPFYARVDRNRFIVSVYLGDTLVRTWPVGLGGEGRETPTGKWRVTPGKKIVNPPWWDRETGKEYLPDDPENPLGERWIGLDGIEGDAVGEVGIGIHGTIRPPEIGRAISRGCVRLYNDDVEVLYDMLIEEQSLVWVHD